VRLRVNRSLLRTRHVRAYIRFSARKVLFFSMRGGFNATTETRRRGKRKRRGDNFVGGFWEWPALPRFSPSRWPRPRYFACRDEDSICAETVPELWTPDRPDGPG